MNLTFSASAMLRAANDLKQAGRPERIVQEGAERQLNTSGVLIPFPNQSDFAM
jgi:hypothetical protein